MQNIQHKELLAKNFLPEFGDNMITSTPVHTLMLPSEMEPSTWSWPANIVIRTKKKRQKGLTCVLQVPWGRETEGKTKQLWKEQVPIRNTIIPMPALISSLQLRLTIQTPQRSTKQVAQQAQYKVWKPKSRVELFWIWSWRAYGIEE